MFTRYHLIDIHSVGRWCINGTVVHLYTVTCLCLALGRPDVIWSSAARVLRYAVLRTAGAGQ